MMIWIDAYLGNVLQFSQVDDAILISFKHHLLDGIVELMMKLDIKETSWFWLSILSHNENLIVSPNVSEESFTEVKVIRVVVNVKGMTLGKVFLLVLGYNLGRIRITKWLTLTVVVTLTWISAILGGTWNSISYSSSLLSLTSSNCFEMVMLSTWLIVTSVTFVFSSNLSSARSRLLRSRLGLTKILALNAWFWDWYLTDFPW